MIRPLMACLVGMVSSLVGSVPEGTVAYERISIPSLGGDLVVPKAMDGNKVVGESTDAQGKTWPFVFDAATKNTSLVGSQQGAATSIRGDVIAGVFVSGECFVWNSKGDPKALALPTGFAEATVCGIAAQGDVLGAARESSSKTPTGQKGKPKETAAWTPLVWNSAGPDTSLKGPQDFQLVGRNKNGVACGNRWKGDKPHAILLLGKGEWEEIDVKLQRQSKQRVTYSRAIGITSNGTVIGTVWLEKSGQRVFRCGADAVEILGTDATEALGFNDEGNFVGEFSVAGARHAFVYDGKAFQDLHLALSGPATPKAGWIKSRAVGINSKGDVAIAAQVSPTAWQGIVARRVGEK